MPSRLHEGMTRTQSPGRGGLQGGRTALLTLLAALLILTFGWAVVSVIGGDGSREARAQTSEGGGSDEIAQTEPAPEGDAGAGGDDSGGDPYAAFGEPRNPFAMVVEPAAEEGGGETTAAGDDGGDGSSGGTTATNDNSGSAPNPGSDSTGDSADDGSSQSQDDTGASGQDSGTGGGTVSGPNGEQVDCGNPADDFERILCEERRGGASDAGSGSQESGEQQQGEPGSGGSGRSGAGEPTESFRNGGGGALK